MTISSSLNAGVAGLNANASKLAAISENIANSSTFGFKRATTEFDSMVLNGANSTGAYSAGGVRASTSHDISGRGGLVSTASALDLALGGRGMLPVSKSASFNLDGEGAPLLLATTGSFKANEDGILKTQSGLVLLGWPANADGTMPVYPRDTVSGLKPIAITANQTASDPTTAITLGVNLPADATAAGTAAVPLPLAVEYYDNLGSSATLDFSFAPTIPATGSSNSWAMTVRDSASAGAIVGTYNLTFNGTRNAGGSLVTVTTVTGGAYDPATGNIPLQVAGGPLSLSIGRLGETTQGLTQLSKDFAPVGITKNGTPVGNFTSVEVDKDGFVLAHYDTGFIKRIYQIPLVDVPNVNGLNVLDNQTYSVSPQSGSFFLWGAGQGPTGDVISYALEGSTTDVAAELTSLIQTQRAYSSNAKVIQTVDEMLQETTNIKR